MGCVSYKKHNLKEIMVFDFTDKTISQILDGIEEAKTHVAKRPQASILALTDLTGMKFNSQVTEAFKGFTAHNKPYIKASAIVGIQGLQKIAYQAVMAFSKRNIPLFKTRAEALDWLVGQ